VTISNQNVTDILSQGMQPCLFPSHLELVPQLNEVYELELAFYESKVLSDEEIIRNGAYFARVDGTFTRHFLMCKGDPVRLPQHSSSRLRSFFKSNLFKTGYATHGLFPYRGKFHPQMIKGLINVMGLKPGDTVLDPMMGSGTVLIEARLMGIKSVGFDASPFCKFMTQVKLDGLTVPLSPVRKALKDCRAVFEHFQSQFKRQIQDVETDSKQVYVQDLFSYMRSKEKDDPTIMDGRRLPDGCEAPDVFNFLLLAYMDSVGYHQRSRRKSHYEMFQAILERYLFVAEKIQQILEGCESELAEAKPMEGDACSLMLEDSSIDGVIFSPPYSFAIDYLENDLLHLSFLGIDINELRSRMIGLRGGNRREKFNLYKSDMERVLAECARVLRPGRICTIVVGTNSNQLSKILQVPLKDVPGLDELFIEQGAQHGLRLVKRLERQITGMANTMRSEFIVMLQRT
jgi:hypothetical protein